MDSKRRVLVFGGCALALSSLAGTVQAASPPRVGIMRFVGKGETDLRVLVTRMVGSQGFALVGAVALEEAAEPSGHPLATKQGVQAAGAELALAAIIDGRIELEKGGVGSARIAIRNPQDGSIVANELFTVRRGGARALAKLVAKTFWLRLGPPLEDLTGHEIRPGAARRARGRQS